ncbi:proximal tail fiber subunit [Klebsiella phage CPRSB]|nr:proximal tail fiber subunit [Klebsiella phage CPRSB]
MKLSKGLGTWSGNDVAGSTLPDDGYAAVGVAVSPYELNLTLKHYLPIGLKRLMLISWITWILPVHSS